MIASVETEVTSEARDVPEGKWTLGGGYILYGEKDKGCIRNKLK